MTSRETYLDRVARELRADRTPPEELHVTPIATIQCGRKEIVVEVMRSQLHRTSCRVRARAPKPVGPGRVRLEQSAFMYLRELDVLLGALSEAQAQVVAGAVRGVRERDGVRRAERRARESPSSLDQTIALLNRREPGETVGETLPGKLRNA